jgi:hypothetical protein
MPRMKLVILLAAIHLLVAVACVALGYGSSMAAFDDPTRRNLSVARSRF